MILEQSLDCKIKVFGKANLITSTRYEQLTEVLLFEYETKKVLGMIIVYIRQYAANPLSYVEMDGQRQEFSNREEMNAIIDKLLIDKNYEVVRSDNGLRI